MFEQNERVCVLNEFGQYVPCVFKGYIGENNCQLFLENDGSTFTELVSRVIKLSEILSSLNKSISECYAMIDHFIVTNNKSEINAWRRMLQANKLLKRRLKA